MTDAEFHLQRAWLITALSGLDREGKGLEYILERIRTTAERLQ